MLECSDDWIGLGIIVAPRVRVSLESKQRILKHTSWHNLVYIRDSGPILYDIVAILNKLGCDSLNWVIGRSKPSLR